MLVYSVELVLGTGRYLIHTKVEHKLVALGHRVGLRVDSQYECHGPVSRGDWAVERDGFSGPGQ